MSTVPVGTRRTGPLHICPPSTAQPWICSSGGQRRAIGHSVGSIAGDAHQYAGLAIRTSLWKCKTCSKQRCSERGCHRQWCSRQYAANGPSHSRPSHQRCERNGQSRQQPHQPSWGNYARSQYGFVNVEPQNRWIEVWRTEHTVNMSELLCTRPINVDCVTDIQPHQVFRARIGVPWWQSLIWWLVHYGHFSTIRHHSHPISLFIYLF